MTPPGPFSADELRETLAPLGLARPLPARAYIDDDVLRFEVARVLARSWVCVAREQELLLPGSCVVAPVTPEGVAVVRGHDLRLRAFSNACQHRGACLLDPDTSRVSRIVCPYHGWTYGLDGALRSTPPLSRPADDPATYALPRAHVVEHAGLVFVCAADPRHTVEHDLDGIDGELGRFSLRRLHLGRRVEHEAGANWKLLAENFLESLHFPAVHPELERLTPHSLASTLPPRGRWFGGTMDLVDAETVSLDGKLRGRPLLRPPGDGRIYDYLLFPNCMLSVQPDYLLTYRLWPRAADRTRIVSEIWFHPSVAADPGFDPTPVFAFWDRTNAQDRAVCERQQRGLRAPSFRGGRYCSVEESSHRFATMIAQLYAEG